MIKLEENNIASGEVISKFTTHHISRYADLFSSDIAVINSPRKVIYAEYNRNSDRVRKCCTKI